MALSILAIATCLFAQVISGAPFFLSADPFSENARRCRPRGVALRMPSGRSLLSSFLSPRGVALCAVGATCAPTVCVLGAEPGASLRRTPLANRLCSRGEALCPRSEAFCWPAVCALGRKPCALGAKPSVLYPPYMGTGRLEAWWGSHVGGRSNPLRYYYVWWPKSCCRGFGA